MESDFAAEWKLNQEELNNVQPFGFVDSKKLSTTMPEFEYFFRVYPNGCETTGEKSVSFWLYVDTPIKKIKGTCNADLYNFNEQFSTSFEFASTSKKGRLLFNLQREYLFNPNLRIFQNGKATLKITGTFQCATLKRSLNGYEPIEKKFFGQYHWDQDETKDFTIAIGGKTIKAHKGVLRSKSSFFAEMFNAEAPQDSINVEGFEYETVEKAVKNCYDFDVGTLVDENEISELIKFAKIYGFQQLTEEVGYAAVEVFTNENVCHIANAAKEHNAETLKLCCMNFLLKFVKNVGYGPNLKYLDPELKAELVAHMF